MIKERIVNIIKDLKIPITMLLATKEDYYRKPSIGSF